MIIIFEKKAYETDTGHNHSSAILRYLCDG